MARLSRFLLKTRERGGKPESRRAIKPNSQAAGLLAFLFAFCIFSSSSDASGSMLDAQTQTSDAPAYAGGSSVPPSSTLNRPAIVSDIRPVYLSKTTKLEIISDRPLSIKQVKLSKGGILRIEIFNAVTSLPSAIAIDKGILRAVAFETEEQASPGERPALRIYVNLTEPVIYEVLGLDEPRQGLVAVFENPILEQLVSLDVNEESLSTVILMLFTQYGANIVAGSNVSGKVTAHLVDVPLHAALDEILKAEGYGYIEEGGLIRVLKAEELEAEKQEGQKAVEPEGQKTESKLFELKYASATDIQKLLKEFVGTKGTVLTDQRTNSVIVISSSDDIRSAEEIIVQLDKEVEGEVAGSPESREAGKQEPSEPVVVTRIVKRVFRLSYTSPAKAKAVLSPLLSDEGTVEVIEEEQAGRAGAGSGGQGGAMGGLSGTAGGGVQLGEPVGRGGYIVVSDKEEIVAAIEKEIAELDKPVPQVDIEALIVEGALSDGNEFGIDWTAISEDEDMSFSFSSDYGAVITKGIIPVEKFTGILNALANSSELRVLSNPSITTLEGQPAMFHSGDKIPYSKIFIQDGIEQVDTVFEEVGIVLAATPHVKEDDVISLVLSTSVSSEGGFTPSGQPRIATRTTRSQVLVKSGDTVAIAGLISDKTSTLVSKVPIIGDVPIIGRLFSTESDVKQRSEVTIFITPRLVN